MVSSPFGGVEGYRFDLLESVWSDLGFAVPRGSRVLEVGCGRAWLREYGRRAGWKYRGVDLSAPEGAEGPDALASAEALPFADSAFERLVCIDAYEHFRDPRRAAMEFFRVLAPGAEVFLSTPNYANVAGLVKALLEAVGTYAKDTWAPFGGWTPQANERFVTIASVNEVFLEAGFRRGRCLGSDREIHLGLFPWAAREGFAEGILYRLQAWGPNLRRALARKFPTLSLHQFRRWKKPG